MGERETQRERERERDSERKRDTETERDSKRALSGSKFAASTSDSYGFSYEFQTPIWLNERFQAL